MTERSPAGTPALGASLRGSLRLRWWLATVAGVALALTLAGVLLADLFRDHVMDRFEAALARDLDQVTAGLSLDDDAPRLDSRHLTDPRWSEPYAGLYWQVDRLETGTSGRAGVLRSRSLWDTALVLAPDPLPDGAIHRHLIAGPAGQSLLVLERTVRLDADSPARWRLAVAADTTEIEAAIDRFNGTLAASLTIVGVLMGMAALAQVAVGLQPLRRLREALAAVREGHSQRLAGRFPSELKPLIDDFNAVLERNERIVEKARTEAGDLAHALKTPLAVLSQAGRQALAGGAPGGPDAGALARLVDEQVGALERHVQWHLARARRAAGQPGAGSQASVRDSITGIVRVMERIHAGRALTIIVEPIDPALMFAGDARDLQEILGNLLDNGCKWATSTVRVAASAIDDGRRLRIAIADDGPGLSDDQRAQVLRRGVRLDETIAGSGLGLAIVDDLVGSLQGELVLRNTDAGGLCAEVILPAR
ncbi:MAG: sensor histidine kinase [Burkholderiaceae bacterium]